MRSRIARGNNETLLRSPSLSPSLDLRRSCSLIKHSARLFARRSRARSLFVRLFVLLTCERMVKQGRLRDTRASPFRSLLSPRRAAAGEFGGRAGHAIYSPWQSNWSCLGCRGSHLRFLEAADAQSLADSLNPNSKRNPAVPHRMSGTSRVLRRADI